ncbi:MAG: SH3 domain-containing protein [Pseudolabrys sp.]|nr:SH3 domain-containing protein [Pseudolabrys sp.]MDP2294572.1 SH3 domain-containing protein [Pseudolabrys sp.]
MRHARSIFGGAVVLAAVLGCGSAAFAKPAYVTTTVNLRAAPGTTSEIVGKIPGGSLVDASECSEGWCAVTWQGKVGFSIQTALDMSGRVPQQRRVVRRPVYGPDYYYDEPPVYYVPPPPPFYGRPYYGRPYYGRRWHHRW